MKDRTCRRINCDVLGKIYATRERGLKLLKYIQLGKCFIQQRYPYFDNKVSTINLFPRLLSRSIKINVRIYLLSPGNENIHATWRQVKLKTQNDLSKEPGYESER